MEKRTEEIIAVCKGRHNFGDGMTFAQSVAAYMSDRCACPIDVYTENVLLGILFEAVYDYIDGADKPSFFLRQIEDSYRLHKLHGGGMIEAICGAFSVTQVRDGEVYQNGFTEKSVFFVEKRNN